MPVLRHGHEDGVEDLSHMRVRMHTATRDHTGIAPRRTVAESSTVISKQRHDGEDVADPLKSRTQMYCTGVR